MTSQLSSCQSAAVLLGLLLTLAACGDEPQRVGTGVAVNNTANNTANNAPSLCDGVECDDGQACTDDACDQTTGECVHTPRNEGCDDGLFCNGQEVCDPDAGCVAGEPVNCADDLDCTNDSCDEEADACVNAPDSGACDDGLFCNGQETCDAEAGCVDGEPVNCADDFDCTNDSCDEEADACVNAPDSGACDDELFCNGQEVCDPDAGCVAGEPVNCADDFDCTNDSCDEEADACVNAPDSGACDDGLFCNGQETCDAEAGCVAGEAVNCADDFDCTNDSCDEEADACVNAPDSGACDDGLFCNGQETCDAEAGCVDGEAVNCADDFDCTTDSCDEEADACVNAPDSSVCDDELFCNGQEVCDPDAGCVAGEAVNCGDDDECTTDVCDEAQDSCLNPIRDPDGDGDGDIACGGGDCAEGDPERSSLVDEVCDGIDNDCDDEIDEGVLNECGNCDPNCRAVEIGGGGVGDFDQGDFQGVTVDENEEGLVITVRDEESTFLWVPNTSESTMSRWDANTGTEIGRYRVGLPSGECPGSCCWVNGCNMPSRVAVDGKGDAYIANRGFAMQGTVTKVALDIEDCVDRNENNVIDTSSDGVALPYGEDECVLWTAPVGPSNALLRGMAIDLGDPDHPEGYPWAGGYNTNSWWKLDPDTGEVLQEVAVAVPPYGGIVTADGKLWIGTLNEGATSWLDTQTGEAGPRISYPLGRRGNCRKSYGITADVRGRIWFTGWDCNDGLGYDPATETWTRVDTTRFGMHTGRGITPDSEGRIWMAVGGDGQSHLAYWNADDFVSDGSISGDAIQLVALPPGHNGPSGVGADGQGDLWVAHHASSQLVRVNLATMDMESFTGPNRVYTYSDFTGSVRRTVLGRGIYMQDFDAGCDNPTWGELIWEADQPEDSAVAFNASSSDDPDALEEAPPIDAGRTPDDPPPIDLQARFTEANVPTGRHLRVSLTLQASTQGESPLLRRFRLQWLCPTDP